MNLRKFINQYIMEVMSFEDENDKEEIKVGNYQTKYFHVCPGYHHYMVI